MGGGGGGGLGVWPSYVAHNNIHKAAIFHSSSTEIMKSTEVQTLGAI